ncbi:Prosaposin receptor GPR37 [Folsomia candida]|uniref:Prosaposin receptor GPR37 n=2 Tax=Folsomia candida TaxID=158441 RepID=A0A226EZJ7_FOLCA|nr:Prosaposin receptor GPR37 [Folsomia candida]
MTRIINEAIASALEATNSSLATSTELIETMVEHGMEEGFDNNATIFNDLTEYIFDRTDVRAIFLTLYTIVFCSCFFGNLMVMLVVCLHWRMRSITNFCLANLA